MRHVLLTAWGGSKTGGRQEDAGGFPGWRTRARSGALGVPGPLSSPEISGVAGGFGWSRGSGPAGSARRGRAVARGSRLGRSGRPGSPGAGAERSRGPGRHEAGKPAPGRPRGRFGAVRVDLSIPVGSAPEAPQGSRRVHRARRAIAARRPGGGRDAMSSTLQPAAAADPRRIRGAAIHPFQAFQATRAGRRAPRSATGARRAKFHTSDQGDA